jgi:hypothetical protein
MPNRDNVILLGIPDVAAGQAPLHQGRNQQGGVPFIHVITGDVVVPHHGKDGYASQGEHCFLAKAIMEIAAIEPIRQPLVPRRVLRQACIE